MLSFSIALSNSADLNTKDIFFPLGELPRKSLNDLFDDRTL